MTLDETLPTATDGTYDQLTSEPTTFAFDSLESVRKKLLDLSGRNILLNYRHPKGKSIRLIDELPDSMVAALRSDKNLTFIPVPEPTEKELIEAGYIDVDPQTQQKKTKEYPTAEQWAKHLGLATAYDLPDSQTVEEGQTGHQSNDLQTLLYARELGALLRNLRSLAEMALDEGGTNILYLGIGFLEWYESRDSDTPRIAPLFTLPVQLQRAKQADTEGTYPYTITLKDDGLLTNISLREKLNHDFGLELPAVEEETTPEAYFVQVRERVIKRDPRWKIRRQASLMLLNFTKQAMFEDLNPANWPANANIQQHPLIARLFGVGKQGVPLSGIGYEVEHPIDDIPQIHEQFPIVFDADSSQHSALVDAVKGENLVIEGPPGTGKSQTIANIIAACIANGKRVLFVAEKMAALNVVKDRLDKAGLGSFCLELHSHKTNKQKILHDLSVSINARGEYRLPKEINTDIQRFEDLKHKLHYYAQLINSSWAQTELSLHEIFSKATRYREQLGISPENLTISGIDGKTLTPVRRKELFDHVDMLRDVYDQVSAQTPGGTIANHYWYGVNNTDLLGYQADELGEQLLAWTNALASLQQDWEQINSRLAFSLVDTQCLETLWQTIAQIRSLPELQGGEPLALLPSLSIHALAFKTWLDSYEAIHQEHQKLLLVIEPFAITHEETLQALQASSNVFQSLGLISSSKLEQVAVLVEQITKARQQLQSLEQQFVNIRHGIPSDLSRCFTVSHQGLREFHILLQLITALPAELWRYRDAIYDNPDLDPLLERMTRCLQVLTPLHKTLPKHFSLERLPEAAVLKRLQEELQAGGVFKWFSSPWRTARKAVLALAATPKPDGKRLLALLPEVILYVEGIEALDQLNREDNALQTCYQGIETPLGRVQELRQWYKAVRAEYGIGFGERVALGAALFNLDRHLAMGIQDYATKGMASQAISITQATDNFTRAVPAFLPLQQDTALLDATCGQLLDTLTIALARLKGNIHGSNHNLMVLTQAAIALERQQQAMNTWQSLPLTAELVSQGLPLSLTPGEFSQSLLGTARNTLQIVQVMTGSPALLNSLSCKPDAERYQSIQACSAVLQHHETCCTDSSQTFTKLGAVNLQDWAEPTHGKLAALISRNRLAVANPQWLHTWLDYIRLRTRLRGEGLEQMVTQLENRTISTPILNQVVQLAVHHQLATEILAQHPALSRFNGMEQMAIRSKFQQYDRNLLILQRELVAYKASRADVPVGNAYGKVGNFTELSLIRHNMSLKKPRIAVRTLVGRAGQALQALKPCFMMSPMSVAQYLTPGAFNFDVVIMDEASQIRPEDALGAIARGNSLVVVGDPKQLPPTAFFQKATNNDDNDDSVALESSESILETIMPLFKNRRLRWHYRSRHESLIAFSNQHFYDANLVLFPSPMRESPEFGIRFLKVEKGRFVNRRNVEEAIELVDFAVQQLLDRPEESVGIVAMNAEQSDEIERQLEQRLKEDTLFQKAYEYNLAQAEPLFIKNLENVQGDERDVILISMTYGPETVGAPSMHQRFGPINSNVGWRRLNVLFTRSKKRMHIYSSMDSGHIRTSETSSRGVQALKAFLLYGETGVLQAPKHTGRAADSDFEIAVSDALAKHGYECEPQLGVSGYRLDLAVKDPGMPGRFLIGIECDGASYHSAKSTRDRDRLRQDILEGLGWRIHRIWSTDWFKNPQAQLQPILNALDKLKTPVQEQPKPVVPTGIPFNKPAPKPSIAHKPVAERVGLELDLRTRLINFDQQVIRPQLPHVDEQERLLRSPMLEALVQHRPCSKAEFLETIPAYLRSGTAALEGEFLDVVLDLIANYG